MKRKHLLTGVSLLMSCLLLAGCGAAGGNGTANTASAATSAAWEESSTTRDTASGAGMLMESNPSAQYTGSADRDPVRKAAKLIYTAELNLETTEFDTAASALSQLVEDCGGYLESSSVDNGGNGYRYANYTVRVPANKFSTFCTQAGELCHVTYQSSSTEDVSQYYYDTEGRLKTQQTKLERLQSLLAKAEKMEDIITIESAISETEAQIESLGGELRYYDALVDYSTVNLYLSEVYRLSNTEEPASGFGSRLTTALSSGADAFVSVVQGLLVALAYGWIWLVLIAAGGGISLWILRRNRRRRRSGTPQVPQPPTEPKE